MDCTFYSHKFPSASSVTHTLGFGITSVKGIYLLPLCCKISLFLEVMVNVSIFSILQILCNQCVYSCHLQSVMISEHQIVWVYSQSGFFFCLLCLEDD